MLASERFLRETFDARYSERGMSAVQVEKFHDLVRSSIGKIDPEAEGYSDPSRQRDLSVKFHWGHNHRISDSFAVAGRMEDRHHIVLAQFMENFGLEKDLTGKSILDIGCWTGGISLSLAALGASVIAIEEVRKYSDAVNGLAAIYGLSDRLICHPKSLYEFLPVCRDRFDIVIYSGVVYHVTDPVLSLRLVFDALRDGGRCFFETYGIASAESICSYEGPRVFSGGTEDELSRGGWNYFIPSRTCLERWCLDAGFQAVSVGELTDKRLHGAARRSEFRDILRAGLSDPHTR